MTMMISGCHSRNSLETLYLNWL